MSRYYVTRLDGDLTMRPGTGRSSRPIGASFQVHDALVSHRLVATYRTEDFNQAGHARALAKVERLAHEHAARLNAPARPEPARVRRDQPAYSFRPACPCCAVLCPPGSRYCSECGTYLYLTEAELRDLSASASPSARKRPARWS